MEIIQDLSIQVLRQESKADWTLSSFYFNGDKKGVGIEDEKRAVKVKGETRILNGKYKLSLKSGSRFSSSYYRDSSGNIIRNSKRTTRELKEKFHTAHELIKVEGVPNFSEILWHWGNTDDDTAGCYIVGSVFGKIRNQEAVLSSRVKYEEIYPIIWRSLRISDVYCEYKDEN